MQWLYLIIAAVFEIGWIFSLKKLSFSQIKKISFQSIAQQPTDNFMILLPLLGYIAFGLANIYFFSLAMKHIPASTAFAVWMGVTLAGVKLIEVVFFQEPIKGMDFVYFALILVAVTGLKKG
ncbi:MAG: DMT family transporter [Flammeovirgaceae bacterium]